MYHVDLKICRWMLRLDESHWPTGSRSATQRNLGVLEVLLRNAIADFDAESLAHRPSCLASLTAAVHSVQAAGRCGQNKRAQRSALDRHEIAIRKHRIRTIEFPHLTAVQRNGTAAAAANAD
jgi:hypothetical protein